MEKTEKDLWKEQLGKRLMIVRGRTSQANFAKERAVSKNTMIRYEKGEGVPDAFFITKICKRYNLNIEWLLYGQGPQHKVAGVNGQDSEQSGHENPLAREGHILTNMPTFEPGLVAYVMERVKAEKEVPLSKEQIVDAAYLAYLFCQPENRAMADTVSRLFLDWAALPDDEKERQLHDGF